MPTLEKIRRTIPRQKTKGTAWHNGWDNDGKKAYRLNIVNIKTWKETVRWLPTMKFYSAVAFLMASLKHDSLCLDVKGASLSSLRLMVSSRTSHIDKINERLLQTGCFIHHERLERERLNTCLSSGHRKSFIGFHSSAE
ncbi:uncharacterized protein LOC143841072 [Paroedura picta]|uniref:uncharacterized protein LOC143841072 n=1 Tax=Paroedura picta TaxID=143630 RepID=UPI004055A31A